jgi:cytochrome P450
MAQPGNVLEAVVHPDPYPYYASLRRARPLFFDASLGLWVATTCEVVQAALRHPALRVRPPAEPVPRTLAGTPAGKVFAHLVRMNDGKVHARHRPGVDRSASRFTMAQVARAAADAASDLGPRLGANALLSALPVQAMARLIGVPAALLDSTVDWVESFVQGIAPRASATAVNGANEAVLELIAQGEAQGLDAVQSANRIALMQQSLDATAGLIGNTVRLLRQRPELGTAWPSPHALRNIVAEVARWDSPVQNTRRFAAADLMLAGRPIAQGEGVVLVLGSANRDEALGRNPDVFDANRRDRCSLSFGAGTHACPGEAIAVEIAAAGLRALAAAGSLDRIFGRGTGFRLSTNARIPVFET